MVMDANGFLYVAGLTGSNDFEWVGPNTLGNPPIQVLSSSPGFNDGAIIKFGCNFSLPCNGCRVSFDENNRDIATSSNVTSILLFPNPFEEETRILITDTSTLYDITITDINGVTVFEKKQIEFNQTIVIGKNLVSGVYIVKLFSDNQMKTMRLVKMK